MNPFVLSSMAVILTSYLGGRFTSQGMKSLGGQASYIRPKSAPPSYVFPIVWTVLYALIAYVFGLAIQSKQDIVIKLFVFNLLLNVLWCYFYFARNQPNIAFLIMGFLIGSTVQILKYFNESRLLIPYLAWLTFAALLNYESINDGSGGSSKT